MSVSPVPMLCHQIVQTCTFTKECKCTYVLTVANIDILQFADEKTTWKILQQARQQQEELQEEFGLIRYFNLHT